MTRVAWLGNEDAGKVMVLIAGTHGVEGHAGSAVQIDLWGLIEQRKVNLPEDVAILMIHPLNPFGYAWSRRCDEQGSGHGRQGENPAHWPSSSISK